MKRILFLIMILLLTGCSKTVDVDVDDLRVDIEKTIVLNSDFFEYDDFNEYEIGKINYKGEIDEVLSVFIFKGDHLEFLSSFYMIVLHENIDDIRNIFKNLKDINAVYIDEIDFSIYIGANESNDGVYEDLYVIDGERLASESIDLIKTYKDLYTPEELGLILRYLLNSESELPHIKFFGSLDTLKDFIGNPNIVYIMTFCDNGSDMLITSYVIDTQVLDIDYTKLTEEDVTYTQIELVK